MERIKASYDWGSFDESNISEEDVVIIHDASRSGITEEMIDKCLEAMSGNEGVVFVNNHKEQTQQRLMQRNTIRQI